MIGGADGIPPLRVRICGRAVVPRPDVHAVQPDTELLSALQDEQRIRQETINGNWQRIRDEKPRVLALERRQRLVAPLNRSLVVDGVTVIELNIKIEPLGVILTDHPLILS